MMTQGGRENGQVKMAATAISPGLRPPAPAASISLYGIEPSRVDPLACAGRAPGRDSSHTVETGGELGVIRTGKVSPVEASAYGDPAKMDTLCNAANQHRPARWLACAKAHGTQSRQWALWRIHDVRMPVIRVCSADEVIPTGPCTTATRGPHLRPTRGLQREMGVCVSPGCGGCASFATAGREAYTPSGWLRVERDQPDNS